MKNQVPIDTKTDMITELDIARPQLAHIAEVLSNEVERLDIENETEKVRVGGPNQIVIVDNRKPKPQKSEVTMEMENANLTFKVQISRSTGALNVPA